MRCLFPISKVPTKHPVCEEHISPIITSSSSSANWCNVSKRNLDISKIFSDFWGQVGWITWGQEFKTSRNLVSTKNTKISWAWWGVPVIPATQEAEAIELLEPRRRRLQWAEIAPLHSSLGNKSETWSQKKKVKLCRWSICEEKMVPSCSLPWCRASHLFTADGQGW